MTLLRLASIPPDAEGARTNGPGIRRGFPAFVRCMVAVFSAACASCPRGAAFGRAAFFFARAAPRRPSPGYCRLPTAGGITYDASHSRHGFRFGHLADGGPRVPDGEEELGSTVRQAALLHLIHVFSLRYRVLWGLRVVVCRCPPVVVDAPRCLNNSCGEVACVTLGEK